MKKHKDSTVHDTIPRLKLARIAQHVAEEHDISRNEMAVRAGDAASQMSRLMTNHVTDFSADRIARTIVGLGCDFEIIVRVPKNPRRKKKGKVKVTMQEA